MKKAIIILMTIAAVIAPVKAALYDSLYVGAGFGLTDHDYNKYEISFRKLFPDSKTPWELVAGFNLRPFNSSFDSVANVRTNSHALFVGMNTYMFKNLFVGLRWDALTYNTFSDEAEAKFKKYKKDYTPGPFLGMGFYFTVGFNVDVEERFKVKVFWNGGMHNYKISNGKFTVWNYSDNDGAIKTKREGTFKYNQTFTLTLEYLLTN